MKYDKSICLKCKTNSTLTNHHIVPLSALPSRIKNRHTARLCRSCHDLIEDIILKEESRVGKVRLGLRFKLPHCNYYRILTEFIEETPIYEEETYYIAV